MKSTVTQAIDHKNSLLACIVMFFGSLFYGYQFCLRVSPSVMTNELSQAFQATGMALGALSSYYYNAYSLMQLPVGGMLDKWGPKKMLLLATALCAGGCMLFACAHTLFIASVGRFLIGAGSAFGWLSCMKIAAIWFSPKNLPIAAACAFTIGTAGAMSGSRPLAFSVETFGWRHTIAALAVIGISLMVIFIFLKDKKAIHKKGEEALPFHQAFMSIMRNPQTWIIGLYGFLIYSFLSAMADMWGVKFLMDMYNLSKEDAAIIPSIFYLGAGIGSPLFAYICRYHKSYKPSLYISGIIPGILILPMIFNVHMGFYTLAVVWFLIGLSIIGQTLYFPIVCQTNVHGAEATASGVQNFFCMISGVAFQPLIGAILDATASNGGYTAYGHTLAMGFMLVCIVLSSIVAIFIKDVYPQDQ